MIAVRSKSPLKKSNSNTAVCVGVMTNTTAQHRGSAMYVTPNISNWPITAT